MARTVAKSARLDYCSDSMLTPVNRRIRRVVLAGLSAACVGLAIAPSALADPAAPSITSAPSTFTNSSTWSVAFSGDTGNTFECRIDTPSGNGTWDACESPIAETTGSTDGTYTVRVRQVDGDSVTGPAVSATFTIDTVAPDAPSLSGAPSDPVSSTSASITISGDGGTTFTCSLDSGSYNACGSPYVATGLTDGEHTLNVKQVDAAGNESDPQSVTWTVDTTGPEAPVFGSVGTLEHDKWLGVEFTAATDATAIECAVGESPSSSDWAGCSSPYTPADGWVDGDVTLNVRTYDSAGNVGSAATVSFGMDSTPPAQPTITSFTSPTNDANTGIEFDSGEAGLTYQCALVSGPSPSDWFDCASPFTPDGGWTDGNKVFKVRAVDAAGNLSILRTRNFVVDTVAPNAPNLISGPSSTIAVDSTTILFGGEPGGTFTCTVDGGTPETCGQSVPLTGLSNGSHTVEVVETDAAGNTGDPLQVSWTVDVVPPDTTPPAAPELSGTPSSPTNSSSAEFTFTGEAGGAFTCSVDGEAYHDCTSPAGASDLAEGSHTFAVKVTDAAGNVSDASSASWTVDTTPPPVPSLSGLPTAVTLASGATATFASSEPGVSYQCRLNLFGTIGPCVSPWIITGLNAGVKTVYVRAKDSAGNVSAWATATWPVRNPCGTPFMKNPIYKDLGKGNVQIRPFASPADVRAACGLLTAQVWNGPTMPLNSDHLTDTPSFSMKIVKYSTLIKLSAGKSFVPKWIRVENKVGTWSNWYQLGKTR